MRLEDLDLNAPKKLTLPADSTCVRHALETAAERRTPVLARVAMIAASRMARKPRPVQASSRASMASSETTG
jgi:hypothetical protein